VRRSIGIGLVTGLISCLIMAVPNPAASEQNPTSAAPGPSHGPAPVINWAPCGGEFVGLGCGTAAVPLDYDRPRGKTIPIALARVPASNPANRIGTVFVNPGGPGGSGVGMVLDGFGTALDGALGGRFDVIGFDPRGVGASQPLRCFDSQDELDAFLAGVPLFPYRKDQYRPFFATYRHLAHKCLDRGNDVVDHMSTADVARDLDLLRRSVGDRQLTFLGFSYGSYLGNTYANLFPRNIRAMVIDGVLDPRLWSSGRQIVSDRVATQHEFDEMLRLCDEAGPDCAFSAPGGSADRWENLATALRAQPLALPDGSLYTYDFLIADATGAMYAPESWGGPEGFGAYLDALADAVLGDQAAVSQVAALRQLLVNGLTVQAVAAQEYNNGLDAFFGNQCADIQYPQSLSAFRLIDRFAAAGSRFGPYWWWTNSGCAAWPVNDDRYIGPWSTRTAHPVLVVGNYFDGITHYDGAKASAKLLRNSRLLGYAGWGHTAYGRSECVFTYVNSYLVDGSLPAEGTVCPANPNPFLTSVARTSAPPVPSVGLPPIWTLAPLGR